MTLKDLFGRLTGRPILPEDLTYEQARDHLEGAKPGVRADLARRDDVRPEILYFLAEDESAKVRQEIAGNPATPVQADQLLAADQDDDVRCKLAYKVSRLVPELDGTEKSRLRDMAVSLLETLVKDQLPRVRAIIAEEIKHSANVPSEIVNRLARDVELIVAEPILEYSPVLSEQDLLEIIATTETEGSTAAVARRAEVSASVADAVVETMDVDAITALLGNDNAQIREETLDTIIDHAPAVKTWHEPIVRRPNLPLRAVRQVANFVASSMLSILAKRNDLDDETTASLNQKVQERLGEEKEEAKQEDSARAHAEKLYQNDKLTNEAIQEFLVEGRRALVIHGLSMLTDVSVPVIHKILEKRTGKALTALTWRSGLSMRTALRMQTLLARIPPNGIVNARNGVDYPMTEDEMNWHLEIFGV